MITARETKTEMATDPKYWLVHLMDFVDDFRHYKDARAIAEPFALTDERKDAVLASVVESLCDEMRLSPPKWVEQVPACREPYFVAGLENLKAIAIVESPLRFRMRKIFVLENFLSRV